MALDQVQPAPRPAEFSRLLPDGELLELLPAAVYVCDKDGLIVRYNRKAEELWGRAPNLGDTCERYCGAHRLFRPNGDPLPHDETPMADALRTGRRHRNLEVRILQPGGSIIWALVNIDPILDEDGRVVGAINCFQDITERKETDRQLRESRALLEAIIETSPECVKIVAPDGELVHMNSAGLRMIEAGDASSAIGGSTFNLIAPECRDDWRRKHERVCRGERLTWEFDIISLEGRRRHMETHAAPLNLPDGRVVQLAITHDITRRKADEAALRASERRIRELLDALPSAVYTTDADGRVNFFNRAATALAGREPQLGGDQWCIAWKLYRPDGAFLPPGECPMAVALRERRAIVGEEAVAERPDGTRVPILAFPTPLFDADGELVGAINMLVDITDRKREEERRALLVNELNHRVKNTLATVQSIVVQTFRSDAGPEAPQRFQGRLLALSKAHDILTRENWAGADIEEIARAVLAPLCEDVGTRFSLSGPPVQLPPRTSVAFAMCIHELCTNAIKYGALSSAGGGVAISWETAGEGDDALLRWRWREHGGPPVTPPERTGFGSRLLQKALAAETGAHVELSFAPEGVACAIDAPVTQR